MAESEREAGKGFLGHLQRRIIVVSTMERDVRITFAVGAGVVAISALLTLCHPFLGPPVASMVGNIPSKVMLALIAGEFLVISLFSYGLLQLRGRGRLISLGVILVGFSAYFYLNDFAIAGLALLVPIALQWSFAELGRVCNWSTLRLLACAAIVASVTLGLVLIYAATGLQVLVISLVGFQALFAMLGLFMAAMDFAEMFSVVAEGAVSKIAGGFNVTWSALLLTGVAIIANILVSLRGSVGSADAVSIQLGSSLGLVPWLALIYWPLLKAGKKLDPIPPQIGYRGLLFVVGTYFLALQAGFAWRLISDPATYQPANAFGEPKVFTISFLLFLAFLIGFFTLGRHSAGRFVPLAFGVCVGMIWFHYYASQGGAVGFLPDVIALGSVVFLVTVALMKSLRAKFGTLCMLVAEANLCYAAYYLLVDYFLAPQSESGAFGLGQALLLFTALAWDIVWSGETTNHHSVTFPRISRVCFFLSYVASVALLVVVSTTSNLVNPINGTAVTNLFESEPLVAVGLLLFGGPFFFMMFALRVRESAR